MLGMKLFIGKYKKTGATSAVGQWGRCTPDSNRTPILLPLFPDHLCWSEVTHHYGIPLFYNTISFTRASES
jgi:hypothetical protein